MDLSSRLVMFLEKGRKPLPEGTIRVYGGIRFKKLGGKWVYASEGMKTEEVGTASESPVDRLKKALPKLKKVNLTGMPEVYVKDLCQVCEEIGRDYPANELRFVDCGKTGRFWATVGAGMVEMTFNTKSLADPKTFQKQMEHSMESGWHPRNIPTERLFYSVVVHEFAHTLFSPEVVRYAPSGNPMAVATAKLRSIKNRYSRTINSYRREVQKKHVQETGFPIKQWVLNRQTFEDPGFQTAFISKYAEKNLNEFVAEAFTMAKCSSTPSPFAVEVLAVIDKYLAKKKEMKGE